MSHASPAGTADVPFPRASVAVPGAPAGGAGRPRAALVTGASSGIGAAVARRFSAQGRRPVLGGRDAERLRRVAERAPASLFPADPTRPGAGREPTRFTLEHTGRTDLLVAGAGRAGDFAAVPPSALEEVVEVGLPGTSRLVRQVVPHMVEAGSGRVVPVGSVAGAVGVRGEAGSGRVVPVGSVAGAVGVRGEAVYSAARAAPGVFADAPRYEPRGSGVAVGLVVPGVVDTPSFERRGVPRRRSWPGPVPPERVADAVWSAVSRGRDESRVPGRLRGAARGLHRRLAAVSG